MSTNQTISAAGKGPRSRSGRMAILALLIPIVGVMIACGTSSSATTTSGGTSSNGSGSGKSATSTPKQQQAAKVGDTITIDGVATTLVSVKPLTPGQYDTQPSAGQGYFVVHVKMVNHGSSTADYNEFDFKALTGSGSTVDQTYVSAEPSDQLLQSGQIAPGGSVEGDMVYELGTGDHAAKLVWQPGLDNSLSHGWLLGI